MDEDRYVATPPVSLKCVNCGETIYQSMDRWYHLNTGARLCVNPYAGQEVKDDDTAVSTAAGTGG